MNIRLKDSSVLLLTVFTLWARGQTQSDSLHMDAARSVSVWLWIILVIILIALVWSILSLSTKGKPRSQNSTRKPPSSTTKAPNP